MAENVEMADKKLTNSGLFLVDGPFWSLVPLWSTVFGQRSTVLSGHWSLVVVRFHDIG